VPLLSRLLREDVRLSLELPPAPLWIRADRNLLEQVVMNLVVNARDALPRGGNVGIRCRLGSWAHFGQVAPSQHGTDAVFIEVWDDGEGVPEAIAERIFEPFFTTKLPGVGTGLGLSTARTIVRQVDGELLVRPREPRGSTFSMLLPVAAEPEKRPLPLRKKATLACGSETILVVEDDRAVLRAMTTILERQGYEVLAARSCTEATQRLRRCRRPVRLLLSDVVLPDGSGYDLARSLASQVGAVLFLTGYSDVAPPVDAMHSGEAPVLTKPVAPERLLAVVRHELDRYVESREA
jgi:two-component system, cell cycle sensor histidine kinase and response regulator CckA